MLKMQVRVCVGIDQNCNHVILNHYFIVHSHAPHHYTDKLRSLARTRTLTVGTSGLIPKRTHLKFQTSKPSFCCFLLNKML